MSLGKDEINELYGFHAETIPRHRIVRSNFAIMTSAMIKVLPKCEEADEAFKKLREASFWANAAVATLAPVTEPVATGDDWD